ncbi:MAG: CRISPR-associated endoribonuclease Cas6 [Candidatus Brocadiae bacterium]|nr:CRISPR-associated endoribonuclease Cas6 [Candidatus Brocadiia bacterium]
MRLELNLTPLEKHCTIPINYQYPLSGAIYQILANSSPEYANWLHNQGYSIDGVKALKFFVFSRLFISEMEQKGNTLIAHNFKPCKFYISSPIWEDFIQNFVIGSINKKQITIASHQAVGHFEITSVQALPKPDFPFCNGECQPGRFLCLSPVVVSNRGKEEFPGKAPHYIRPEEPEFPEAIRQNLLHKFILLYGHEPENQELSFSWDKDYIEHYGGYQSKKISKLITIREGSNTQETQIKAFLAPFYLSGSEELIYTAYECGIGEKNSLGFGMIQEENQQH